MFLQLSGVLGDVTAELAFLCLPATGAGLGRHRAVDRRSSRRAAGRQRVVPRQRTRPPLSVRRLGDGPILLVVENADTFDSLRRDLAPASSAVGHIAWGSGAAFEASVLSVAEMPEVQGIVYFGDLDADGLRIPASAASLAAAEGLPPVRSADGLYRLQLERGIAQPGQTPVESDRASTLARWLGESAAGTSPCGT